MKSEDIRQLTKSEIRAKLAELAEARFRLRFRGATQPLEDPLQLRALRKDIARLNTILRERAQKAPASAAR